MALKLTKGQPKARPVPLDGGVTLYVRPATYPESIEASERIAPMIVALREGSAAAIEIAGMLGDEFAGAVFDDAKLASAAQKLAMMELVALCCERMDGELLDDEDQPIVSGDAATPIDAAIAGLLLRDPIIARKLRAVIEGPLYEVIAEKNASATSPNGGVAAPDTAPDAAKQEAPAPPAVAE